jgi:hypothetical protein
LYNPIKNHQFVHGEYVSTTSNRYDKKDAVIANVKDVDTGESRLHIIENPMWQFWVTKPGLRNHEEKKECVKLNEVDSYMCTYSDRAATMCDTLYGRCRYPNLNMAMTSPYIYGGDITPLQTMKIEYIEACDRTINYFKVGMLDIETSVLGDNQILLISYADFHTRKVYCGILGPWAQDVTYEQLHAKTEEEYSKFREGLNSDAQRMWDENPFTVEYRICGNEKELMIWVFANIHQCKPDFCGVWNMSFDIPYIMERAVFRGIRPADLFCHPEVPADLRYAEFKEDKSPLRNTHITDKWHIFECPGYTRWYDPMCLYSRLRVVDGKLPFYTLDFIGNLVIGTGKMSFGVNDTHYTMQTSDHVGYAVYNTLDVVVPSMINAVTDDVVSMTILAGCSLLSNFASQTVRLRAYFYEYCRKHGLIPGTVFGSQSKQEDLYLSNIGGAVLDPLKMRERGASNIKEINLPTNMYKLCCDIDFTSQYPSILMAMNISKATKMSTMLHIEGSPYTLEEVLETKDIKDEKGKLNPRARYNSEYMFNFLCRYMATKENAVDLSTCFSLPGYGDVLRLWDNRNNA